MNANCEGALLSKSGGPYLPWGPYLDPGKVRAMRAEMIDMIALLAALEGWPQAYRDAVLTRTIRGPLSDLMPNHAYFTERTIKAQCAVAAAELRDAHTWHGEGFEDRFTDRKPAPKIRSTKARGPSKLDRLATRLRKEAIPPNERRRT